MTERKNSLLYYASQPVLVLIIAAIVLRLYDYDLKVPFSYWGDSIVILAFIKGIILNGWAWSIPQLSAPFEFSAAAFPIATSFDWLLIKGLSVFTSELGLIVNGFWLLTLSFSAWSATYTMQLLRVDRSLAYAGGILYALLPYAFLRNVGHLNLVYYLVPLIALLATHIASGFTAVGENARRTTLLGYAACTAQGFNYVYFSFFGVLLLTFSGLLGYAKLRTREPLKISAIAVSLLVSATALNLAPSLYSWHKYGKPPDTSYKSVAEAEIYGAKLRQMVSPHSDNLIPGLGHWGQRDLAAHFPNENENVTARLGLVASAGFFLLLLASFGVVTIRDTKFNDALKSMASLSLFSFLVITVGGIGAIINIVTVPDIRAYNRFSVFIAWFSLAAIAVFFTRAEETAPSTRKRRRWLPILLIAGFLLSLYDQLLDRKLMLAQQQPDSRRHQEDRRVVQKMSALLPNGGTIFQLPVAGFPIISVHEKMVSYDHLRPFLWSPSNFKWSSPSFSQHHRAWQERVQKIAGADLLDALAFSGFDLIWIDRSAYKDNGNGLIADLLNARATRLLGGDTDHIVLLDIRGRNRQLKSTLGNEGFAAQAKA